MAEIRQEKGAMWKIDTNDDTDVGATQNGHSTPVPKVKDVIGRALPHIGAYKGLDNKQQKVALIDDVSSNDIRNCTTYMVYPFLEFIFTGFVHQLRQMLYDLCRFRLSSH